MADDAALRNRRKRAHARGRHDLCRPESPCRADPPPPVEVDRTRAVQLRARWRDRVPDEHLEVLDEAAAALDVLAAIDAELQRDPTGAVLLSARATHSRLLRSWLERLHLVARPAEDGGLDVEAIVTQAMAEFERQVNGEPE